MATHANPNISQDLETNARQADKTVSKGLFEKLTGIPSHLTKSIRASRDFKELNQLSNRELHDMGINRGDISRLVHEAN